MWRYKENYFLEKVHEAVALDFAGNAITTLPKEASKCAAPHGKGVVAAMIVKEIMAQGSIPSGNYKIQHIGKNIWKKMNVFGCVIITLNIFKRRIINDEIKGEYR